MARIGRYRRESTQLGYLPNRGRTRLPQPTKELLSGGKSKRRQIEGERGSEGDQSSEGNNLRG